MEKRVYEISFVLSGRLTESEIQSQIEKIKNLFQSIGVTLIKESEFNKINLAYPIKKETEAFFGYFWFETEPEKIKELKEQLTFEKNVLRYLIVVPPPKYKKVASIVRPHKHFEPQKSRMDEIIQHEEKKSEPDFEKLEEKLEEIQKLV